MTEARISEVYGIKKRDYGIPLILAFIEPTRRSSIRGATRRISPVHRKSNCKNRIHIALPATTAKIDDEPY